MMVSKEFNSVSKFPCPICGTMDKKEVVLVAIEGKQEGLNCEARQVHLECLELWLSLEYDLIYQKLGEVKKE